MNDLDLLIQQFEGANRGVGSVPNTTPSPVAEAPTGTPSVDATGASSASDVDSLIAQFESAGKPQAEGRGPVLNYLGGFNDKALSAAHALYWVFGRGGMMMAPKNFGDEVQSIIKSKGSSSPEYQASLQRFKETLGSEGMATSAEPDSTLGHIGRNTFDAVVSLGGLAGGAEALAATQGASKWDYLKRTVGESLIKHPWLAAASDVVGGVPGSTIGEEHFGAAGAMAGGVVGNLATLPAQKLGKGLVSAATGIAGKVGEVTGLNPRAVEPTIPTDVVDAYRAVEAKARAMGEVVVQAGTDLTNTRRSFPQNSQEVFNATHRLWAVKRTEQAVADEAEQAWLQLPKEVRGKFSQESVAIRNEFADPVYPKQFAEEQIAGDRKMIEDSIAKALDQVRPTPEMTRKGRVKQLTAEDYAQRMSEGIVKSEKLATDIEGRYWARVPLQDRMPERGRPLDDLINLEAQQRSRFPSSQVPDAQFKALRALFVPMNKDGEFQKLPTLQKLRAELTDVRQEIRTEIAKDAPSDQRIAALTQLEASGHKWIGDAFPNNVPLQQARAASAMYHEMFTKTELFPLLRAGMRGQAKVRDEDTLQYLIKRPKGMQDLYNMTDRLLTAKRLPKDEFAYPTALRPEQLDQVQQLRDDTANGLRQAFREEVQQAADISAQITGDTLGATAKQALNVQKILDRWEPRIKAFANVAGELQHAMGQAIDGVKQRRMIENSALVKYFESNDAAKAVDKVWSAPNAPSVAKALITGEAGIGGFAKDPVALEGFRAAMTDKLFTAASRSGAPDPKAVEVLLRDGRVNRLMTTVLGGDRMERLQKVVSAAISMDKEAEQGSAKYFATWVARIAAVKISALMPHFGRGGELQQAALFSEMAKRKVMQYMAGGDPVTMMTEAVRNPAMERLMFSTVKGDAASLKQDLLTTRRVLRMDVGLRGSMEAAMEGDGPGPKPFAPNLSDLLVGSANAGEVVPLPITPGPNAGRPTLQEIVQGRKDPNVLRHPKGEEWHQRVKARLQDKSAALVTKEGVNNNETPASTFLKAKEQLNFPNAPYDRNFDPFSKGIPINPGRRVPSDVNPFRERNIQL